MAGWGCVAVAQPIVNSLFFLILAPVFFGAVAFSFVFAHAHLHAEKRQHGEDVIG
jgi:hypothetical protein